MSGEAMKNPEMLSNLEIDTIGEIMNISMGAAATAASTLLEHKVTITAPTVNVVPRDGFDIGGLEPVVAVEIKYVGGISGSNILLLRQRDARTILAKMMQQDIPEDYVLDDMGKSAMCELMNQMMGSSATVLSCFLGRSINISTPLIFPVDEFDDFKQAHFPKPGNLLTIKFDIAIKDVMESEFISVMDVDLSKEIIDVSLNFDREGGEEPMATTQENKAGQELPPVPQEEAQTQAAPPAPPPAAPQTPPPAAQPVSYTPPTYTPPTAPQGAAADPIMVQNYDFADLGQAGPVTQEVPANIGLVMDVPVVVTVELGRTKRKIKEILEFGTGTIVQLDKQAGAQVDVIVNGQLIARGDVVVVDDNFSIRITEILKSRDTLSML